MACAGGKQHLTTDTLYKLLGKKAIPIQRENNGTFSKMLLQITALRNHRTAEALKKSHIPDDHFILKKSDIIFQILYN